MLDIYPNAIDPFCTKASHKNSDIFYLSDCFFKIPQRSIRNNSNINILIRQTRKTEENIYRDVAGFDMSFDDIKELGREALRSKEIFKLYIDWFNK